MSVQQNASTTIAASGAKAGTVVQSAMAICLGLFVVGFVGFSHVEIVHNAAHDTRHANAFPCH
ncbi:CbtB-domain containing protein [Rhizobium sp. LjRoot30]|uniref:CbtB domain-containing protein n=1 Tax=Rhizobium sp. LjRoot30 TaxID=3342320 RepID=UPI003ED0E08B